MAFNFTFEQTLCNSTLCTPTLCSSTKTPKVPTPKPNIGIDATKRAELTVHILKEYKDLFKDLLKTTDRFIAVLILKNDQQFFAASIHPQFYGCCISCTSFNELEEKYKDHFKDMSSDDFGIIAISGVLVQYMTFAKEGVDMW